MNPYLEYDQKLLDYISFSKWIIAAVVVVTLGLILLCIKVKYKKMAVVALVGGVAISLIAYAFCVYPYQKDINNQSYVTYTGEFYVEEYYSVNRGGTYILISCDSQNNATRYKVLCDVSDIENDKTYNGTFVYSESSKCLVDITG